MCHVCWTRLPGDLRQRLDAARRSKARHVEAKVAIEATDWLLKHAPAVIAARRTGEAIPP
jgi:GH18 family chitinase